MASGFSVGAAVSQFQCSRLCAVCCIIHAAGRNVYEMPYEDPIWIRGGWIWDGVVLLASPEIPLKDSRLAVRLYFQSLAMAKFCHW